MELSEGQLYYENFVFIRAQVYFAVLYRYSKVPKSGSLSLFIPYSKLAISMYVFQNFSSNIIDSECATKIEVVGPNETVTKAIGTELDVGTRKGIR